jgi:DNA excision repair protein ERCC-4
MIATETGLPPLPALRHLGDLADMRPTVIIDTREQTPLPINRLPTFRTTLQTGDYSFRGGEELLVIERKTIADLVACCTGDNRERFERELHRLRGYRFKRLLIVGAAKDIETHGYHSNVKPGAVLASLYAFEARYNVPVVFKATPEQAARQVEVWIWYYARELVENTNAIYRATKAAMPPALPRAAPCSIS